MKTFNNVRARMPVFALMAALLLLSSLETWTHAAAPITLNSDFVIASEGDLDPSFGAGGKVTTDFFNHLDRATDLALQPDGRIIVVGGSAVRNGNDDVTQSSFAIMRYNSDGSLDASFGNEGKATTDFLGFPVGADAVALYPDGRFVVAGFVDYDKDEDSTFGVARYNSDGSLDTTFDDDGKVVTGGFIFDNHAYAVAVQPDGKVIVAGLANRPLSNTGWEFTLVRYNIDGSLDANFGSSGIAFTDFFGESDDAQAMILQPDGKIIVAGDIVNLLANTNHDFGLVRYNSDGSLDASFGSGGKAATDFFKSSDAAQAVALQPDGKIIAAGYVYGSGNDYDFGLARYNSDGSLDTSFGKKGKIVTDFLGGRDTASALSIQPDGKIIAAGFASTSPSPSFTRSFVALARYSSDGSSLDASFGINGKMVVDFFGQRNGANALAMQPDGKLVVAGYAQKSSDNYDIALMRLFAFTPPDFKLQIDAGTVEASRGKKLKVNVEIGRVGGFAGNVIVSAPDANVSDMTISPNPASTTGSKIKFKIKIKNSAPVGPRQITFTGRDETGRERSVALNIMVK
jgi:uncharacterized delta-60 repeat protein